MADVVVFHPALGLRAFVHRFADSLRSLGHTVHTPDLFDGKTFDDFEQGVAERDAVGPAALMNRARSAVEGLSTDLVYVGFSMGAAPAQILAATRPGARSVVLVQGGSTLDKLGIDAWPDGLPVQLHVGTDDEWFGPLDAARLMNDLPAGLVDYHEYSPGAHLFVDHELSDYDAVAASDMLAVIGSWISST